MKKGTRPGPWLVAAVVVIALAVVASWLWMRSQDETAQSDGAPEPVIRDSATQPGEQVLVIQGRWHPRPHQSVRMPTAGPVAWAVEDGAIVAEGEVLGRIASNSLQARLGQAQARTNIARQQVRTLRQLVAGGYEPAERLTAAEAELDSAGAELVAAEQAAELALIRAPVAGQVRLVDDAVGELAEGAEVARIFNRDPLRVVLIVPEKHAGRLRSGAVARADLSGVGTLEGRISSVGKTGVEDGEMQAEIELPNPDHRRPEASLIEVRIPL